MILISVHAAQYCCTHIDDIDECARYNDARIGSSQNRFIDNIIAVFSDSMTIVNKMSSNVQVYN